MSKKLWAAVLLSSGLVGGAAQAADVTPMVGYDWTGFYIGAQAGYGWGETEYSYDDSLEAMIGEVDISQDIVIDPMPIPGPSRDSVNLDYDGIVGGGTIGYNWQHDSFVFGIEADISLSGINGDEKKPPFQAPCYVEGCSADINWFGTGRLRAGYAIDNVMPFITGGVAVVGIEGDADLGACGYGGSCGFDDTKWGWTLGGGVEWGFSDRWSAKAEYLYVNVDSPDFSGGPNSGAVSADDFDFSVVRMGINYRLN